MVIYRLKSHETGHSGGPVHGWVIVPAIDNFIPGAGPARVKPPVNRDKIEPRDREDEMGIEILLVAFGVYAAIWLAVIAGSQFFGPR
jgi:hypothetical protein